MREIQVDYLVVGAGASAMAFVDELLTGSEASVVMVDRRHRPGGHWLDAYPFVRLHQPSANYGVTSQPLGRDRIDDTGINAGFYERATAPELCDYYARVMDGFVGSGRVQFLPMTDYLGDDGDGHHVRSLLSGAETTVRARRLVDATCISSEIPSRRPPAYAVDDAVRVLPPNDLVHLGDAPGGFTVIGAGKTAMDTCCWLLENGVDPDRIRWVRPRDPWMFDRAAMQPLDLVASYMQMQACYIDAAADARDATSFAHRLEDAGMFVRLDRQVEPSVFRGATISARELESLRTVERVVHGRYVRAVGPRSVRLDDGELPASPGEVYVDCTAPGVPSAGTRPIFDGDRILLQYVTLGIAPWSGATIGVVEASRDDDAEKNRLCPPLSFTGNAADLLQPAYVGMGGLIARGSEPDLFAWTESCRLNPAAGAMSRLDDPAVAAAFTTIGERIGPAMRNLAAHVAGGPAPAPAQRAAPTALAGPPSRAAVDPPAAAAAE